MGGSESGGRCEEICITTRALWLDKWGAVDDTLTTAHVPSLPFFSTQNPETQNCNRVREEKASNNRTRILIYRVPSSLFDDSVEFKRPPRRQKCQSTGFSDWILREGCSI